MKPKSIEEYGVFHDRKVDDFDFPCSDLWRGYYEEQYGMTSRFMTSKLPERKLPSQETSDLKPIRTIMRENNELKTLIGKIESDVSGLKKGYHTHLDKKRTKYNTYE